MEKIKIPKTIKVGGLVYTIITETFPTTSKLDGIHDSLKLIIKINLGKNYSKQYIISTFIHEILHAIDSIYTDRNLEESTIAIIAKALYGFILDNNFGFNNVKMPYKLKIGTVIYKIKYNYNFEAYSVDNNTFSFSPSELILAVSKDYKEFRKEVLKVSLIEAFLRMLDSEYNLKTHEDFCELNKRAFANGIYQVFKDNKVEEVIRSVKK